MTPSRCGAVFFSVATLLLSSGYKEVAPPEKVVLPAPLSPTQSLAAITVPADLVVELVAAEPMVMDPIDLTWGADGRMWVVEMADYPKGMGAGGQPGGRIRVLESTRQDGHYDKSTLFAEGLRFPTSVRPWRHGVLVTATPDILFLADTDGDGRADHRETLFTGLAKGNEQHLANGLQWGLDGWLYLANGNSGGTLASTKGGAGVDLGQRDFRIRPDDGALEVITGASQFGRNRDDWGQWFGCNNSNPIRHFALEDHYLRRNPHLVTPSATVNVPPIPGAARVYPRSRTFARFNDPQGFNHFTSACGVMIYNDSFLGPAYAGNVFVAEPVHNLVHREIIQPVGVTFKSERAPEEQTSEFLASTDNWSRFTAIRAGPDGALYIADMYRLVIEHPQWIPDAWQKELGDLRVGAKEGRIYRVRPKGVALRSVPALDRAAPAALVKALASPSGLIRDLAQQQLAWSSEKSAVPALRQLAWEAPAPTARAQALWTLRSLNELTPAAVARALRDPDARVRRQGVRLSEDFAATDAELLPLIIALVEDPDAPVRQQVGYSLGAWPTPAAGRALARLLRADNDPFIRAAAISSSLPHTETLLAELTAHGRSDDPLLTEIAVMTDSARAFTVILTGITRSSTPTAQFRSLARLLDGLQRNNKSLAQLKSATAEKTLQEALVAIDPVFIVARRTATDHTALIADRLAAVQLIGRGRTQQTEDLALLARLLTPQSPTELQLAVVNALGRINQPGVPSQLLGGWTGYGRAVRTAVLELVMSRPAWAQVLLDRLEADPTLLAQIEPGRRAALTQHSNAKLAARAAALFKGSIDQNRQQVIDRYLAAVETKPGDAKKGASVFAANCSACHAFGTVPGRMIGPDLATVKDRSPNYLVTHILDPNRAVEDRYLLYTAATRDGRALAGMVSSEAGNSITLLGLDGAEQIILRNDLQSLLSTARSLMPDGLEAAIDGQAMADLVALLSGTTR